MRPFPTQHQLHRTAKLFMDNGRAASHEAAMDLLHTFGLNVYVGADAVSSVNHQTALLTLVNVARRTFLGGVRVFGDLDLPSVSPLAPNETLIEAVTKLGGVVDSDPEHAWPSAHIGDTALDQTVDSPAWHLTWSGWRGGVVPRGWDRLDDSTSNPLAPTLAAAACAAEAFSFFAKDHPMVGRRPLGLSLWNPRADWLESDSSETTISFLPSRLWIIGLGNLGQAFSWLLASLPYPEAERAIIVLQDFDTLGESNDSTSMLSSIRDVGEKKTRVIAYWLERRGFNTVIEERRFSEATKRASDEPGVALCGVDNPNARAILDRCGFDLVVEAGLGAGPQSFRSVVMHTFPASRPASDIWPLDTPSTVPEVNELPAYNDLKEAGMDECGLTLLASRTVGVPFVGLIAGCLVLSELLRRLNGGRSLEVLSTSAANLAHVDVSELPSTPYSHGHVPALAAQRLGDVTTSMPTVR